MKNNFHYVVKFEDSPAVLREFDASYLELRLGMLVERMKDADVCFYSDEKGDVHYGSGRVDTD